MNQSPALRLTPSNSPFLRTATPKPPTKSSRNEEAGLKLKKVIGTTCAAASGFACLPSARQFAYTAGAAAVVCTIEDGLNVSQRFFRARPSAAASRDGYFPAMPGQDLRNRAIGNLRDQNVNGSPLGSSMRDWSDSPTGKSTTAKDRVKAATSVALSPNGKWIAVGETGYKPRILIFSNKGDASESPLCALSEHTFGVHALAFSPDSRFLASLGTVNDGFLYVWAIDERSGVASLHSSNKCTSTINFMTWLEQSVLTIGLRYVKLWKPEEINCERRPSDTAANILTPKIKASEFGNSVLSPRHKVLAGKNSLLGDLLDANFVAAVPYGSGKAIICAESGEICLLDASDSPQTLTAMGVVGFRITAAMIDSCGNLHVAGVNGHSKRFNTSEIEKRGPTNLRRDRRSTLSPLKTTLSSGDAITTTAMAKIGDIVVEIDSRRGIRLTKSADSKTRDADIASHQLPAHSEAVLGVKCLNFEKLPEAAFMTFAGNGSIYLWNWEGSAVGSYQIPVDSSPAMYDTANELKAVANLPRASLLVAGDKYGTLSVLDILTGTIRAQVRAHSTEIVDVICFERLGVQLIATASRDRMVQLFSWQGDGLEILQTMDEHAAAVTALSTLSDGDFLLSSSTDRTIVVREAMLRVEGDPRSVVFIILRTITLKSSPLSMCLGADEDELLVSMVDRSISKYSIKNGQAGFSFKCSDMDGGEAAAMSKILYTPSLNGNPTIVSVSSGDKSVRLYSEYGSLIARDWGHTEGISDVALIQGRNESVSESPAQLVTVAVDSTIFMWDTVSQVTKEQSTEVDDFLDSLAPTKHTSLAPPLRKVLSYSELSRYKIRKSIGEDESPPGPSPGIATPTQPPSPRRLTKKSSRSSVLQPPRLEPSVRSSFAQSRRESSIRKRSPSPPSPKGAKRDLSRKPSLGMSLRSKSSENVLSSYNTGPSPGFGSVASSAESVCRNLRAFRKKLASSSADAITPTLLRELATELKLTARVVGEKSQGKVIDEATMAKLLDQASDRIVDRLGERIKERVESEVRRSSGNSPLNGSIVDSPADVDAVAGAMGTMAIE